MEHRAATNRGGKHCVPERWIVLAGLAGSVLVASFWNALSAWFLLPLVLALTLLGVSFSVRRLRGSLSEAHHTHGSMLDELRDLTTESERRVRELRTLYESSMVVSQSTKRGDLVEGLAEDARQMGGGDVGCVFLAREDHINRISQVARGDRMRFRIEAGDAILPRGLLSRLLAEDAPLVISDAAEDERTKMAPEVPQGQMLSIVALPLKSADCTIGGLLLGSREKGFFTGEEVRVLTILANLASAALEKLRLSDELSRRVHDLETRNEELSKAEELRTRLMKAVSLEIREPMTAVHTLVGLLGSLEDAPGSKLRRPLAKIMMKDAERALRIADEAAGLNRESEGPPSANRCGEEAADLLREVMIHHTASAIRRAVLLDGPSSSGEVIIRCDRDLLKEGLDLLFERLVLGVHKRTTLATSLRSRSGSVDIVFNGEAPDSFIEALQRGSDRSLPVTVHGDEVGDHQDLSLAVARSAFEQLGGSLRVEPCLRGAVQVVVSVPAGSYVRPMPLEILQALSTRAEIARLLEAMTALTADLMSAGQVILLLLDSDRQELFGQAGWGIDEVELKHMRIPLGSGVAGEAAASRAPRIVRGRDLAEEASSSIEEHRPHGGRLAVPLTWESEILGALEIGGKAGGKGFGGSDLHLAEHLASLMARALARENSLELVKQALLETLTTMASVPGRPAEAQDAPGEIAAEVTLEQESISC